MMAEVTVTAYARIHIALCDLGGATHRAYGGCGFAVGMPVVDVRASRTSHLQLLDGGLIDEQAHNDLEQALSRLGSAGPGFAAVTLNGPIRQHQGFGSKTALLLACLQAAALANDLGIARQELQRLAGRGGTSGVGVNTYFRGGYVADAGRPRAEVTEFRPSSASVTASPPVITAASMPEKWDAWLMLPRGHHVSGSDELAFFSSVTPIPEIEVFQTLALVHHGITPAILEENLTALSHALQELHGTGFKKRELDCQAETVRTLLSVCWDCGLAAGMSSMGPLVYVLLDRGASLPHAVTEVADATAAESLGAFACVNHGATIGLP